MTSILLGKYRDVLAGGESPPHGLNVGEVFTITNPDTPRHLRGIYFRVCEIQGGEVGLERVPEAEAKLIEAANKAIRGKFEATA